MFLNNILTVFFLHCIRRHVVCNLIFANTKDISMVNLDSSRMDTSVIIGNLGEATALDFYFKDQIVFWSDLATEKIQGMRLGSRKPFDVLSSGISSPDGLVCDWITKKLYWTDADTKRIEVVQFDGHNRKVLFWTNLDAPRAIALVPQEGLLFWTDWGDMPKIERSSMDGKKRMIIVNDELRWPNGLAVDCNSRRIYWTDGKLKYISSVDYQGKNRKKLMSNIPHSFGLTLNADMLYLTDWTNMGISSCNKITEKCKLLLPSSKHQSNELNPLGIKFLSPNLQPDNISLCATNNGGCSHLCLLSSEPPYYSCACPTGILLKDDNATCTKREEKFIILLRKTDIRKISLDTDDHTDVVLPYPKEIKHAIALDYDPVDDQIYWTDDDVKTIRRAYLNSSSLENVITSELIHPDGIAVDWISRNLYWTDTGSNTIQVSRIDGSYRKTLINNDLDEPRAIVVNPWKGLMFWTDWGLDPKIERASLDGSMREKIVTKDLVWPNGLAIDLEDEKIFWGDAKLDTIETCDFNGGSRKLLLDKVAHPFGLTVLDDYIYWTDWHERAIHRTDKRIGLKKEVFVDSIADMMGIKAISIHQDLGMDLDLPCSKYNGGCKQLCLDRHQKASTCACANGYELDFDAKSCKRTRTTTSLPRLSTKRITPKKSCHLDQNMFTCVSGEIDCVALSHRCDGDDDCADRSDEENCPICPEGKISCPSNPILCLDLLTICDKNSPCNELTPDISKLCAKYNIMTSPGLDASSSANIFNTNYKLPFLGVISAIIILFFICFVIYKFSSLQPQKVQPSDIPLMRPNHPIQHSFLNLDTRHQYTSQSPPPDVVQPYTNQDLSRCETNSLSGNEATNRYNQVMEHWNTGLTNSFPEIESVSCINPLVETDSNLDSSRCETSSLSERVSVVNVLKVPPPTPELNASRNNSIRIQNSYLSSDSST